MVIIGSSFWGGIKGAALVRDLILILLAFISCKKSSSSLKNPFPFSWAPLLEVVHVFLGVFITLIPVLWMLSAGEEGIFSPILSHMNEAGMPDNTLYFWGSGLFSAFLDNAPTYLIFFQMTGYSPDLLMTTFHKTLMAISCGTVFMGALTYIGNAPNLMIRAIAEESGVKMPGFFQYMGWSFSILLPLFFCVSYLF